MTIEGLLHHLLMFCGAIHMLQLPALAAAPRLLERSASSAEAPFGWTLHRVNAMALAILIVGFGVVVIAEANAIANGTGLAAPLTAVLSAFWAFRTVAQISFYARHAKTPSKGVQWALAFLFALVSASYLAVAWHAHAVRPI